MVLRFVEAPHRQKILSQHAVRCHQMCTLLLLLTQVQTLLRKLEGIMELTADVAIVPHAIQHGQHLRRITDSMAKFPSTEKRVTRLGRCETSGGSQRRC